MEEYSREPCPWRIVDDCGGAFAMGAVGGFLFHGIGGAYRGPKGYLPRFKAGIVGARTGAPRLGGQFAVWGFTFSTCDCLLARIRRKEDYWNSIASGGITGALLTVRQGGAAMIVSGIVGAVLLGFIEGVGVLMNNFMATQFVPVDPDVRDPSALPPKPVSSKSPTHDLADTFGMTQTLPNMS